MKRVAFLAAPLLLLLAFPAEAQAQSRTGEQCDQQRPRRSAGRRIFGGIAGSIAGSAIGSATGGAAIVALPVASMLGDAVMNLLDCREQRQAATATEEAVRRSEAGEVGATVEWQSETRPGVRGASRVETVENNAADQCMTVTDIVIIDGEETTAPKRMCRRPPSNRYVRV